MPVPLTRKKMLLAIPALALLAVILCVLLLGGRAHHSQDESGLTIITPLAPGEQGGAISFSAELPAEQPINKTLVLSDVELSTYPQPAAAEGAAVRVFTKEGKLYAAYPQRPGYTYTAKQVKVVERRQPDGSVHPLRHILLSCEVKGETGTRTLYLQQLELDVLSRTADPVDCTPLPMAPESTPPYAYHYHSLAPTSLPERFAGSYIQRRISRLVYNLAAVNSPEMAQSCIRNLQDDAWDLAREAPYPALPWPDCWGEHAGDARSAAGRITPTLLYLQEHNCFDCAALADFINSAPFGVIFGSRFSAHSDERLQDSPIEFIAVPSHEP